MAYKNTELTYGSVAKFIHWTMALLFLGVYVSIYYRHWFTEPCIRGQPLSSCAPENLMLMNLHKSIGLTILAFVVLRIIWRWSNPKPHPEPASQLEHLGARVGHFALYFFMITMPITGYIANGGGTDWFWLVDIPSFRRTEIYDVLVTQGMGIDFQTFEKPLDYFHKQIAGAWLVWILILVHVSAALYHHFWKHDQTLVRMLPAGMTKKFEDGPR